MKKYVPRSIQNIFDRVEAFNESITEKLFSEELATTFEVVIYTSLTPQTERVVDPNASDSTSVSNYYFYSARSKAGHHDHLVLPESARTNDEYEKFRNAHFQAIIKKSSAILPKHGDVWLATHNGGNVVTLASFQRSGRIFTDFSERSPARDAHTSGEEPTSTAGDYEDYGPPLPTSETGDYSPPSTDKAAEIVTAYPSAAPIANEIVALAAKLEMPDAGWLANLMNFETGGTFDPSTKNALGSGATGLIQFMPSTARSLGTTTTALAKMTAKEQMVYVEKYLMQFKKNSKSYSQPTDVYMAVFYPWAMGKSRDVSLADHWAKQKPGRTPEQFTIVNPGIVTAQDYANFANKNAKLDTGT